MKNGLTLAILIFLSLGCNEEKLLNEVPLDFLSPENAYVEEVHFRNALNSIYAQFRRFHGQTANTDHMDLFFGTDAGYDARNNLTGEFSDYNRITASHTHIYNRWTWAYTAIFDANSIINRIEQISFGDQATKNAYIAEARFFRAWFYRTLAHLFGGVPLVLEETNSPRRDYKRVSREEIYVQCRSDLEYAAENLFGVEKVKDGMLTRAAANHLLTEVLISLGDYEGAVKAASRVIDDPSYQLMTKRFGSRASLPGDAWRDLFELNNQNRSAGNLEGILVMQVEYNLPGGWGFPTGDADVWERIAGPQYYNLKAKGENVFSFIGPTTYHGGRGAGFFRPTTLFTHQVWQGNWYNDMRNSGFNILRKYWIDNPASKFYNDTIDLNKDDFLRFFEPSRIDADTSSFIFPYCLKHSQRNNHHPVELLNGTGPVMATTSRRSYVDKYAIRLAETYWLRAEAYLGLNRKEEAAQDINKVRARAGAFPVPASAVDIDFILDERIRELYLEEQRRVTLARLNLLPARTRKYNPFSRASIQDYHNFYPIPFREIERNTEEVLQQNPGY